MTTDLVGAAAIVMVGATLQGSVGFGIGMLAAPLLVLIDPRLVPGPLLASALVLTLLVAFRERRAIDFGGMGWALAGRVPGTLLGAVTLTFIPPDEMALLVGALVFLAVGLIGSGLRVERTGRTLLAAGTLSGFTGTTASIGGPPIAILYQDSPGETIRGTMSSFFTVGLVISLSSLAVVGRFGAEEIHRAAFLMPGAVVGFVISRRIAPLLDRGYTRTAILAVSAIAALSAIVQALLTP